MCKKTTFPILPFASYSEDAVASAVEEHCNSASFDAALLVDEYLTTRRIESSDDTDNSVGSCLDTRQNTSSEDSVTDRYALPLLIICSYMSPTILL